VPRKVVSVDTALVALRSEKVLVTLPVMMMTMLMTMTYYQMVGGMGSTEEVGKWRNGMFAFRAGAGVHVLAPVQPDMSGVGPDGPDTVRTLSGGPRPWGQPVGCEERRTLR